MDDPAQQLATNTIKQLATNAIRQTLLDNRGVAFCRSCLVKLVRDNNAWAKQRAACSSSVLPGPWSVSKEERMQPMPNSWHQPRPHCSTGKWLAHLKWTYWRGSSTIRNGSLAALLSPSSARRRGSYGASNLRRAFNKLCGRVMLHEISRPGAMSTYLGRRPIPTAPHPPTSSRISNASWVICSMQCKPMSKMRPWYASFMPCHPKIKSSIPSRRASLTTPPTYATWPPRFAFSKTKAFCAMRLSPTSPSI
jgi:hypothetical protein